jgi:protein involved in polysaccharide export with SLBB domain
VEGFDKRYSGYVVDPLEWWHVLVDAAADFESPFVGRLQADGTLHARGIDTSIGRRLHDRVVMNASYSWWRVTQSTRTWPPVFGSGRPGDYDIRNQVRLEIAYEKPGTWRAGAQFRYASGRPYTPYDVRYSIANGSGRYSIASFNGSSYPPYHRLDVRLDRTFAIGRTSLVVYGELENVYNRDNVLVYEWNKASRQARPVYQWGRLPVAGIRWEF